MSTYRQVLEDTKETLKNNGIFEYDSNAQILFDEAFGLSRLDYLLNNGQEAQQEGIQRLRDYVDKRLSGIPIQYIIGKAEFYGMTFKVNKDVLIPRFDTEVLVEKALEIIKEGDSVLDMCTGSGCIAISLAKLSRGNKFVAADISEGALKVASENARKLEADIELVQTDLFENIQGRYDIIISNPPYIADEEIETLLDEVKLMEPRLALSGGADGLVFYRKIIKEGKNYLKNGGRIIFEIGCDQGKTVSRLMMDEGYRNVQVIKDLAGLDRVVIGGI